MVLDAQAKGVRALSNVAADAAHADDAQQLAFRVVAVLHVVAAPLAELEAGIGFVDAPQSADDQKDGHVGDGVVVGRGRIRRAAPTLSYPAECVFGKRLQSAVPVTGRSILGDYRR